MTLGFGALGTLPLAGVAVTRETRSIADWKVFPGEDPILELYDVEIDELTTLHFVRGAPTKEPLEVDGVTYAPIHIEREEFRENIELDLYSTRLSVSNIDGVAGGYILRNNLEGNAVRLTLVPLSLKDSKNPNDRETVRWTIQDQAFTREAAVFTLGYADYVRRTTPWRRFQRSSCSHAYGKRHTTSSPCFYPSDRFGPDTRQDFLVGALVDTERVRLHGWRSLNTTRATIFDVDKSIESHLVIGITDSVTAKEWLDAARDGPFVYKLLSGDFDVWSRINFADWRPGMAVGFLVQDPGSLGEWLLFGLELNVDQFRVRTRKTTASSSTDATQDVGPAFAYLRLEREGDTFRTYYSDTSDANWVLHRSETLPLSDPVRIGVCLSATSGSSLDAQAALPFVRFRSGGLPACSLTLDGPNGCRAHNNTAHFGGQPGIPRQ